MLLPMVMGAGQRRGAAGEPGGSGGRRPSGSPLRLRRAPRSHPRLAAYLQQLLLLILPSYSSLTGSRAG